MEFWWFFVFFVFFPRSLLGRVSSSGLHSGGKGTLYAKTREKKKGGGCPGIYILYPHSFLLELCQGPGTPWMDGWIDRKRATELSNQRLYYTHGNIFSFFIFIINFYLQFLFSSSRDGEIVF